MNALSERAQVVLKDAEQGICPICKKGILECAVISYQEFYGVQVGICGEHPQP